jgi:phosphohistidine phosphatase SixA
MRRSLPGPHNVRVVVLRHGPAEVRDPARWSDDERRPLTGKGALQTRRAVRGVARLVGSVDRIASSPAERALATAEILRDELSTALEVEPWEELGSGCLAAPIFERLRGSVRAGETVVLVGHDPTLTEFVGLALAGEGIGLVRLGKGGAALLEFPAALGSACGRLLWLLTRKQLSDVRG